MNVAPGHKFACWYLSRAAFPVGPPEDVDLGDGVLVARSLRVELEPHWREWLGTIALEEISAGGLAVYVTAPAAHPEVLDGENEALRQRVNDVLHGLFLQGVPWFQAGIYLTGSHLNGELRIRHFARLHDVAPTYDSTSFVVDQVLLDRARLLAQRLRIMQNEPIGGRWGRLIRSVRILLQANRTHNEHGERFHQFVRSLDGLAKTRPAHGEGDFVHRVQTFALASPETAELLREMYRVRGAVEHVQVAYEVLDAAVGDLPHRLARINRLTRQIDALARFTFSHLLASDALFDVFSTDAGIDGFWAMPNHERQGLWGPERLDIRPIT